MSTLIEYEFRLTYGCYPYDYTKRLIDSGMTLIQAHAKTQYNIDKVWKDMKHTNERKKTKAEMHDKLEVR